MSKKDSFENAILPLKERMEIIAKLSAKTDLTKANNYGNKFRAWIIENFPNELKDQSLNWKNLYKADRIKHIRKILYFTANYKDAYIKHIGFQTENTECKNMILQCSYGSFVVYDKLVFQNDYEKLIGFVTHDMTHLFQDLYKTTLPKEVIDKSFEFYVNPNENWEMYIENPIEKEANIIESIVSKNFINDLRNNR